MIISNSEQNSPEWFEARMGRITASEAWKLLGKARKKDNIFSKTGEDYIYQVASEFITGIPKADISGVFALEHGKANEDASRISFEMQTGLNVEQVGFIVGEDKENNLGDLNKWLGFSADGIIFDEKCGLELKNPLNTGNHLKFITKQEIKPEYICQCQFSMMVSGFDSWYFASADHRVQQKPVGYVKLERDEEYIETLKGRCELAVEAIENIIKIVTGD